MIGRTNAGGGGGGLNFKVVGGTTAPSNPKENTIWINTSTTISSWVFSATQPTAESGKVWISIGTSSAVEFNALKKNGIQVYPLSAKQYISGAWVGKTVKSYQNGNWKEWVLILVKDGIAVDGTTVTVVSNTTAYNYADFSASPPDIHVDGTNTIKFRIDSMINAGGFSKVEISGETQMASNASSSSTYATITADIADKTGATIYASGSVNPTAKGYFQPFDIVIDLKSVSAADTYLFLTCSKNGTYWNTTYINNITIS